MIGLGFDLCQIERIEKAMETHGFLCRYFTPEEQAYLEKKGKAASQSAAAMFAAKEALLKAMGVGLGGGIALGEIGVCHDASGAPSYRLTGEAAAKAAALGVTRTHLTLTHEMGVAGAVVVLE